MYAVFEDGSRQYRVSEGDVLLVDFRDVAKGTRLTFDRVLLFRNGDDLKIGQPLLTGARVLADVVRRPTEDDPNPSVKVYVQKFRRRTARTSAWAQHSVDGFSLESRQTAIQNRAGSVRAQ